MAKILSNPSACSESKMELAFERSYAALRQKENRIYTDEEVELLPSISKDHAHYKEWLIRAKSLRMLTKLLKIKKRDLKILEIGCGNGWLSNNLAQIANTEVIGLDINLSELQQAARIFCHKQNLTFVHGDIRKGILIEHKFDIILFAASLQYFYPLTEIIQHTLAHLENHGEIHIIDSNFYKQNEVKSAKQRTIDYYNQLGFPEMTGYYYHHTIDDLDAFNYKIINELSFFKRLISRANHPFPWICIKK